MYRMWFARPTKTALLAMLAFIVNAMLVGNAASAQSLLSGGTAAASAPMPPGVSASLDTLRALRGTTLQVSLITYGPSDVYFERFGHAALVFRDSTTGEDVAFNWGMFDFNQPRFLLNFLTGDTKYWMEGYPTPLFNSSYRADNRSIREQVLGLSPVEKAALYEFVLWNASEEHKFYRYDYYRDNCATRIRDAIDRVMQHRLHGALNEPGSGRTWRNETARLLSSMLPLYIGIELALGRQADLPLTQWDEEFLPEHMATHYATLTVDDGNGQQVPLVQHDSMLFVSTRASLPTQAPSYVTLAFLVGLTLAGLIVSIVDARTHALHVALSIGVAIWYAVFGILGTALVLAATVTKHAEYMGANSSVFAVNPLLLFAAVIVPLAIIRGQRTAASVGISTVIAVLALGGVTVQLIPNWSQESGVIFALIVPVHIAIAIAVSRMRKSTPAPVS